LKKSVSLRVCESKHYIFGTVTTQDTIYCIVVIVSFHVNISGFYFLNTQNEL